MGLPSYVINFDELSELLRDYLQNGINVDVGNITFSTAEMENLLREISSKIQGVDYNSLITALNSLGAKLDSLGGSLGMSGTQKVYGEMLEIISNDEPQSIEFTIPSSGRITGITYSLSSWNYEDNWDLFVNDLQLFKGVRTKEYGETKFFNVFYPVTGGQKIKLTFNNTSGSSKILWVDFNILEDVSS
jgi:hypothetical protein